MSEKRKQINYTVALVSEFAKKHNMTQKQAFGYLYKYKGIEFVKENYEIEHTLSFADAVSDCAAVCRKNGGAVA